MPDPFRQQTASDESEHLRRHAIEPLRVVDEADERRVLCRFGQEG